jgi:phosphoglycolate phosphatase
MDMRRPLPSSFVATLVVGSVPDMGRRLAILWDIDGTLLRAAGAGVRCFVDALTTVTGLPFPTGDLDMGGRTDPEIARRILQFAGAEGDHDALADAMLVEIARVYAEREVEFAARTKVLAGAAESIDAFAAAGALQTVVTGNIRPVAQLKLAAADLAHRLQLDLGGYGSDHLLRAELVRTSLRRITEATGEVDLSSTWVVGDTPRDLDCARAAGVRCLLVATGTNPFEKLAALGADAALPDLADVDQVLAALA